MSQEKPLSQDVDAFLLGLTLLVLHLVGFSPLLLGEREFVRWDDKEIYESDDFWRGISLTHIAADFQATLGAVYEPLAWLLKGATYVAVGSVSPSSIVLVSLVLHTISSLIHLSTLLLIAPRLERIFVAGEPA
eukprot:1196203-Prorocentrum_minimum.AAC.4